VLQAGFFLAPVTYPIGILPESLHKVTYLLPVSAVIQFSRQVLVERTIPTVRAHLLLAAVTLGALVVGWLVFEKKVPRSIESL
jgi:ABC-type polysaccharide/polyol phosphate export permease